MSYIGRPSGKVFPVPSTNATPGNLRWHPAVWKDFHSHRIQQNSLGDGGTFSGQSGDVMSNAVSHHAGIVRPALQNLGNVQTLTPHPTSVPRPLQPIFPAAAAVSPDSDLLARASWDVVMMQMIHIQSEVRSYGYFMRKCASAECAKPKRGPGRFDAPKPGG